MSIGRQVSLRELKFPSSFKMHPFISHPSVRIKGTENNYEPASCGDTCCPKAWPHLHCPFCVKTDIYTDAVILKAHYRVKHVDKGIEFSGLKILRCCERCELVGTIKGSKEFKGPHWHCYRCRNGFTRRDEAVKHYRTHFRNPSTTFQIQVAQDINQSMREECSVQTTGLDMTVGSPLETVVSTSSNDGFITIQPLSPLEATRAEPIDTEKPPSGEIQVSVAANETVDTSEGQTFMIIHEESEGGEVIASVERLPIPVTITPAHTTTPTQLVSTQSTVAIPVISSVKPGVHWRQEKSLLEAQIRDINAENVELRAEKQHFELQNNTELEELKVQLQMANVEIATYQKREMELLNQLKIPLDERINELLTDLKTQHEELLHNQLAQLRRTYITQLQEELSPVSRSPTSQAQEVSMEIVQPASVTGLTPVMATVSGSNNMVLTGPSGDTTLETGALSAGNIVLSSDGLITDPGGTAPMFVMAHQALPGMKPESGDVLETDQSAMISNALLTVEEHGTETLTPYSHVVEHVGEQNILLSTTVVTSDNMTDTGDNTVSVSPDIITTDIDLTDKSSHIETITEVLTTDVLTETTDLSDELNTRSRKRKLSSDRIYPNTKHKMDS